MLPDLFGGKILRSLLLLLLERRRRLDRLGLFARAVSSLRRILWCVHISKFLQFLFDALL